MLAAAILAVSFPISTVPAMGQTATAAAATVSGTVTTPDGAPVPNATVILGGVRRQTTSTDANGVFRFATVAPGIYTLRIEKAGFNEARQDGLAVAAGSAVNATTQLTASSFSSLRQIGSTSTSAAGVAPINTSATSFSDITNQTFADQGQVQVTKILDETPGIVASRNSNGNGASEATSVIPQIRGALPYETETLIDGHPVSVGANGYFSPSYLNPALLQDVEIAKGPGVQGTDINYAIGGSVNYRTLEPTRTLHVAANLGIDGYGGQFSSASVTGSIPSHIVDYAFGYALNGTPGPLDNYKVAGSQVALLQGGGINANGTTPYFINGRGYGGYPEVLGASATPQYASLPGEASFADPLYVCCSNVNTQYFNRSELAKLRFNVTQQTAITVSYLGAQGLNDATGANANVVDPLPPGSNFSTFQPGPGYAGSIGAGRPIPFDIVAYTPDFNAIQQSLFQSELRTAIGQTTVLARYYSGANRTYNFNFSQPTNLQFSGNTYGSVPLCNAGVSYNIGTGACSDGNQPVQTVFNGQNATYTGGNAQVTELTEDYLRGESLELDEPVGNDLFSVAIDRSHHDSIFYEDNPQGGVVGYQLAPGSGQEFQTILARARLALTPRLTATVSNYIINYNSHFSGDGGVTFQDSEQAFDAPRLAVAWRPNVDVSWRFSAGSSIAPPYLNLLSAPAQTPQPNSNPATYFTLNTNNGNLKPETAFGYDLGFDKRIARSTSLSADVYLTNLHNLFLPSTSQQGTYSNLVSNNVAIPLFITQEQNLAFARYEGIELALQRAPAVGAGYKLQGSLQRGYPYNLPGGFYDTAAGPYTTNQGIISGVNFQPSGFGFNGLGNTARTPYSTGYAEANYLTRSGIYGNIGVTYFGPNNSFNRPAFGVVSANLRVPVAKGIALQFSGDNLTGAYDQGYYGYFTGVPVPLVVAKGTSTANLGNVDGGNYGPATFRAQLQYRL
jgi:hypothetical protein